MQGLGLYLYSTKDWVFGYFRNNSLGLEFETGSLKPHQNTLPDFEYLEKKY
jgi:hypothetical protein